MNKRIKILKAFFKNIKSQIAFIVMCFFNFSFDEFILDFID